MENNAEGGGFLMQSELCRVSILFSRKLICDFGRVFDFFYGLQFVKVLINNLWVRLERETISLLRYSSSKL